MLALFIILVSLTMTLFSEKVLISSRCISGLMPNLIKKSWTDSTGDLQSCKLSSLCAIIIVFSTFPTEKNRQKKLHNNNRPQASRLKQTRRLKFAIDQTLRLEYTVPLAKDFQVTLSGGGALIRHKVAFFAEDEAAAVVGLLDSRGVQVIRKRGCGAERKRGSNFVS